MTIMWNPIYKSKLNENLKLMILMIAVLAIIFSVSFALSDMTSFTI